MGSVPIDELVERVDLETGNRGDRTTFAATTVIGNAHVADDRSHLRPRELEIAMKIGGHWYSRPPRCDAKSIQIGVETEYLWPPSPRPVEIADSGDSHSDASSLLMV